MPTALTTKSPIARYELFFANLADGKNIVLQFVRENGQSSVTDHVKIVTGKSIDGLKKHGKKQAKYWNVPFVDKTGGAK